MHPRTNRPDSEKPGKYVLVSTGFVSHLGGKNICTGLGFLTDTTGAGRILRAPPTPHRDPQAQPATLGKNNSNCNRYKQQKRLSIPSDSCSLPAHILPPSVLLCYRLPAETAQNGRTRQVTYFLIGVTLKYLQSWWPHSGKDDILIFLDIQQCEQHWRNQAVTHQLHLHHSPTPTPE